MQEQDRYQAAKKVTLIGAAVNAFLGLVKVIGGYLFHSHALLADGIHSFSDLLTDAMVVVASKYGSQDADETHPYGHQKIETTATLFLSLLLILAGLAIAWDSIDELLKGDHTRPGWLTLPVIIFSIAANELLFHYTRRIAVKINSALLQANAWHHRSDAASSLVVLLGLIGSLMGFIYLDALAAVIVGLLIIQMGWEYGWRAVKELVDTAVETDLLQDIEILIKQVPGVDKIHQLRTRSMGGDVYIDVHILVAPRISVSEGHYIAQHVHNLLIDKLERVKDVTVHVDPEDDEVVCPSLHLPNRNQLEKALFSPLRESFPELAFYTIHYENGAITLDLVFNPSFTDWPRLDRYLEDTAKPAKEIKEIRILQLQSKSNERTSPSHL